MTIADAALAFLWVAAHLSLRQRSAALDPHDAAPYPRAAWSSRMWAMLHDVTAALGHPPAPSEWTVRR